MITIFIVLISCPAISPILGLQDFQSISSYGIVSYLNGSKIRVSVNVDFSKVILTNNLSLGTQIDRLRYFPYNPTLKANAEAIGFGLVRTFIGGWGGFNVCTYWDEDNKIGIYDWTELDRWIEAILEIQAEPFLCIGRKDGLPEGMKTEGEEGFPLHYEDFAQYCADIVYHTNIERKYEVRYWEIWNEPMWYDATSLFRFTDLFNVTQAKMHQVDPSILCGNDNSNFKPWFDYFLEHAQGMGFLSFHKYDTGSTKYENLPPEEEPVILARASDLTMKYDHITVGIPTYTPSEMRSIWLATHGRVLPIICSETNMNYAWRNGTDPRMQTIFGAVWYAEVLRRFILDGVAFSVYFTFCSADREYVDTLTSGRGFGMMLQIEPYELWHPYFVNYLFTNNLNVGDIICESSSSNFTKISTLSWKHEGSHKLLLIGKTPDQVTAVIRLPVEEGASIRVQRVVGISEHVGDIQEETISYIEPLEISLNGYTITLLTFV